MEIEETWHKDERLSQISPQQEEKDSKRYSLLSSSKITSYTWKHRNNIN